MLSVMRITTLILMFGIGRYHLHWTVISPHLLPNGLFSPQNRISFELLALSGLSGFSTFKGGKMLIFQGFANSRIVREFPPFSFKVRIATLTRNRFVLNRARGFESHHLRQKCLCIARCRGAFSFRTPSSPLRPFRHFSQLRPPSLVQHAQKNSIFLCKKP